MEAISLVIFILVLSVMLWVGVGLITEYVPALRGRVIVAVIAALLIFWLLVYIGNHWIWATVASLSLPNIPFAYAWWIAGIVAAVLIIVVLFRSTRMRGYAAGVATSGHFWRSLARGTAWLLALAILGFGAYGAWRWASRPVATTEALQGSGRLTADAVLPIIAKCESGGRQFDDQGNVVTNPTTTAVGKYQIMASLHEERAKKLGYDIRTLEGNEGYARLLFSEEGTKPWEADPVSRACWEQGLLAQGIPVAPSGVTPDGTHAFALSATKRAVIRVPLWHRWDVVSPTSEPEGGWPTWTQFRDSQNNLVITLAAQKDLSIEVRLRPCTSREDCVRTTH